MSSRHCTESRTSASSDPYCPHCRSCSCSRNHNRSSGSNSCHIRRPGAHRFR
ncbi:hypothetical protein M0802_015714 [Mischocyttarus mexicanus]|nr:hypothetical protein M0802_015729 [Mischocyttarus mexicanus]KAI4474233.1 hypothetical protein M0802_015714 [Mischocyttarus mexicanus]